ncbi:MAG: hypothetical protein IJB92_02790, partial [Clostridia bacterium]|nr:hypothetical protein [Clostridia bacterium]
LCRKLLRRGRVAAVLPRIVHDNELPRLIANLSDLKYLSGGDAHSFKPVDPISASKLILPMKDEYNDYMVFNRTFYHINDANVRCFAAEGKVFEDPTDGSFIVCGARFQHNAALHIAMMGGNYDRCIDFAVNYARAIGVNKVSCTFTLNNEKLEAALVSRGFKPDASDLITKEIVFR